MGLFNRKKSKTPLFEKVLEMHSPEQRKDLKERFSGMGDHEILVMYTGQHWETAVIKKVNQYANSKPNQIKMHHMVYSNSGGCNCYIRGTLTKEDAVFFMQTLKSCKQKEDFLFTNALVNKILGHRDMKKNYYLN